MRRIILISTMFYAFHFGTVTRSDAFLGAIWDTITGWFGGGSKKQAQAIESQLNQALQNTNLSQNNLIMAMNAVIELQGEMQDLNEPKQKAELDKRLAAMQNAINENASSYGQLMAMRDALTQEGKFEAYASQFSPYITKQQEIENTYPKIEERQNELSAFTSNNPVNNNLEAFEPQALAQPVVQAVDAEPWLKPEVRSLIDSFLSKNNRDKWGGPINPLVKIYQPPAAYGKDRYQYLIETYPDIRKAVEGEISANTVQVTPAVTQAPAAPVSSAPQVNNAKKTTYKHMAPTNNLYDKAALREKRNQVYQKMLIMQSEGKVASEEYRDIYLEYTRLSDQLK